MLTRRTTLRFGLGLLAASTTLIATRASAAEPNIYQDAGIAIDGADAVAFFGLAEEDAPVIGQAEHALDWNGAIWHFANAENRAIFEANPEAYAPAFGGYCAYAAARGYVASTVPEAWSVVDGRLFLNYSRRIRRRWLRELPEAIGRGDTNYPAMLG
ncbi:YHS domain-containing (seleno)protein [Jannaschia sp. CCS1]|uniref:YHS domain-containing (seleno)protein n=1 Tax=Jannaschia sp. (strain CCS1) TaxID=290400 RepID=UPI000053AA91|nr:YHS domain-containing (seleno)protein [Jannaschia sp. CCS1]ABD55716.1 twin-arginine translocation pathway signal sequence domain protein putative [Jannaschia sp. CCS1]